MDFTRPDLQEAKLILPTETVHVNVRKGGKVVGAKNVRLIRLFVGKVLFWTKLAVHA